MSYHNVPRMGSLEYSASRKLNSRINEARNKAWPWVALLFSEALGLQAVVS